jgi:hypothetical protein
MLHIIPSSEEREHCARATITVDDLDYEIEVRGNIYKLLNDGLRNGAMDLLRKEMRKKGYRKKCEKAYIEAYTDGRACESEIALNTLKSCLFKAIEIRFNKVAQSIYEHVL